MAVKVEKGASTIRFDYNTPGLYYGVLISAASVLLYILYLLSSRMWIKNHPAETEYPEGDILLEKWREDDENQAYIELTFDENALSKPSILDDDTDFEILTPDGELTFQEYVDFLKEVLGEEYVDFLNPTLLSETK